MAVIQTTHGELDETSLRRVDGVVETDDESTTWVEYWLDDELVHRSVHVTLKRWPEGLGSVLGGFS